MATHDILVAGQSKVVDDPYLIGLDETPSSSVDSDSVAVSHSKVNSVKPEKSHTVIDSSDSRPFVHLMEKVYLFPFNEVTCEHVIDAGLIASAVQFPITILNLSLDTNAIVSNITVINGVGTSLDNPATPFAVLPLRDFILTLTIEEAGPPIQETEYRFTINGILYVVFVQAERLKPLDAVFKPNWQEPVKFALEFQTVIYRTKSFKEQRRPLFNEVKRSLQASFLVEKEEFESAHNVLKRSHDKFFFIPIFNEILKPTNATLQGSGIITFKEDISYYYNLKHHATILLIEDIEDITLNEYVTIDHLDEGLNQAVLDSPITKAYVTERTNVLPVLPGNLKHFKPGYLTGKVATFTLDFRELRLGD